MIEAAESRGTTDSLQAEESDHAATLTSEFFKREPAIEVPKKPYSLEPDIATGWVPKMKVIGPVPLNFDCAVTDAVVAGVLQHARLPNYYRVAYLGSRPASSFKMHEELATQYHFKYDHLYLNNYNHLQPFYRKFYAEFQPQTTRSFRGMNPQLDSNEVTFDTAFESGNLDVAIRVARGEYDIFMRIDSNTRGHLQWYYFRVRNNGLKSIKLNLVNFCRKRTLYQRGMKPFIKPERGQWKQAGDNITFKEVMLRYEFLKDDFSDYALTFKELSFEYEFQSKTEQVEFAYSVPYTYSQMQTLLRELPTHYNEEEILRQKTLGESLSGVDIPILTITDSSSASRKKCLFVVARQHPGESNGSYVMEGFVRWLCSDHPEAVRLRACTVVKVVPMLNPDGVILGNFRTSICGRDLNRLFRSKNCLMFPEVQSIKEEISATKKEFKGRFLLFMDFHGHSVRKNVFTYGPGFILGENNYYRSRIFPKIISSQTNMFRYYSCSFRISEHKQLTARAMISRLVPFCYTVEASNSSYYCAENRTIVEFAAADWIKVGREIGISSFYYIDMIIEEENEAKLRLERIRERKEGRDRKQQAKDDDDQDSSNIAMTATTKKIMHRPTQTSKSLHKRSVRESLTQQQLANQLTPVNRTLKPAAQRTYNQTRIIEQIKQADIEITRRLNSFEGDADDDSDRFGSEGEDSESASDDMPEHELKKFHKAASIMLLDFQSAFLNRNNSEHSVPKSLNTTTVKKRRSTRQKRSKKARSEHQQINVMACLKSRMYPAVAQQPQKAGNGQLEKFRSFQMLEPIGRMTSTKQLTEEGKSTSHLQPINKLERLLPTRNLRPIPPRNVKTRNTMGERLEEHELAELQRFDSLERIEEQPDNGSAQLTSYMQKYQVERERPMRLIDHTSDRQKDTFNAVASKMAWLNMMVPKRDRRGEYLEQARQRLQEYLIRENIGGTNLDKEFQVSRIRVRNLSKNKDKQ